MADQLTTILQILEKIIPPCIELCKKAKFSPSNRKIILDLKVIEQEMSALDDESKRLYPERLAQIEKACAYVAENQAILSNMDLRSYWQRWSKEHRDLLDRTRETSRMAKRMAIATSQDAKTRKALQIAQTKVAMDDLEESATNQGIDPQELICSVRDHAKAERSIIVNNFNFYGPGANITVDQQQPSPPPSQGHENKTLPSKERGHAHSSSPRKPKVHVASKRPTFSGPVRRKKTPKEITDLANMLMRAMDAPPISKPARAGRH